MRLTFLVCVSLVAAGCSGSVFPRAAEDDNENSSSSGKSGSIIGRTTQDIEEYDPDAGAAVSDSEVVITSPITGALEAYGPIVERISKTAIEHQLGIYYAKNGEYPQTHEEFMEKIIRANRIKLPVLPGGSKYQYDVENHKLVVVKGEKSGARSR